MSQPASAATARSPIEEVRLNSGSQLRPAPRLPASRGSLADLAARRPSQRSRLLYKARRAIAAVEPWYDWGRAGIISVRDEIDGDGWWFNIDWMGLHFGIVCGRTPKAVRS